MNRRNFLGAMLAAASAPAFVKAENLMKIVVLKQEILTWPVGPKFIFNEDRDYFNIWTTEVSPQRKEMFARHMDQNVLVSENNLAINAIALRERQKLINELVALRGF